MNKSNQLEPMLNAFLSDLAVLNIKVHNLHWNVAESLPSFTK